MERYVSPVWKHFTPDKNEKKFAICNHCKASISRGSEIAKKQTTKSMELHLKKQHPNEFKPSKKESVTETEEEKYFPKTDDKKNTTFSFCGKKFAQRGTVLRHIKTIHTLY